MNRKGRFCDGIQRRSFLRAGGAGLFGTLWTLPGMLQQQAAAAEAGIDRGKDDRSVIVVFLRGGLSTIDTWDMKPNAPAEFRGDFDPIATNVAGIQIGEHTPRVAQTSRGQLSPPPEERSAYFESFRVRRD